jgi:hypothetical protein
MHTAILVDSERSLLIARACDPEFFEKMKAASGNL